MKDENAEEIEMSEEELAALKARQPQPPPQQQPSTTAMATPSNSKVKVGENGELKIYSSSPQVTPDLRERFENAADGAQKETDSATCQFGPTTTYQFGPTSSTHPTTIPLQEQQAIDKSKINSIQDGKGTIGTVTDRLQDDDWGWKNGGDLTAKTNAVMYTRMEDENEKLKQEIDKYKRLLEQKTTTTDTTGQQLTTANVNISTPMPSTYSIKDIMATIKNGGIANNIINNNGERTDSAMITNGYINRKSQTPNSDDSPDGYSGGSINNLGNGGGNNNGDGGDEPGSGSTNTANRYGSKHNKL